MAEQIAQSTSFLVIFKAYSSTDHATEATGKTIAITISKNGATSFGNPNAGATNATEMANGWYKVTLDSTDTNTLGPLAIRGTGTTMDDVGVSYTVVKATNWGMTALPDTAVTTNASLLTSGTGTAQLSVSSGTVDLGKILGTAVSTPATAGILDVNVKNIDNDATSASGTVTFPNATLASTTGAVGSVTGAVGSVTGAVGSVTGLTASDVGAIKTKTDSLTFTVAGMVDSNVVDWKGSAAPAMTGDAYARLGAPAGASVSADIAGVKGDTAAVKLKTDNLPSDPADASDIAGAFSTVNSTLATIAGYIDTEVGAIKAKTDNLPSDPADQSLLIAATDAIMSRIGAPAGASVSADLAAVKGDTSAAKTKTDQMVFANANELNVNVHSMNDVRLTGTGVENTDEWRPA